MIMMIREPKKEKDIYKKVSLKLTDVPTWSKQNAAVKKTAV